MMLNKHVISNRHIWKFCLYSAIAIALLGIVIIAIQIANYWNQYQFYLALNDNQPGIQLQLNTIVSSGIANVSQLAVSFFCFVSVFTIASILFKRYAVYREEQIVLTKGGQSSQATEDEQDNIAVEIVDLPESPHA